MGVSGIGGGVKEAQAFLRGSWGASIIDQLKPLEGEPVVLNFSASGFCYTDLDLILRNRGIRTLVMTGLATNFVVESTTREAFHRCYSVVVLEDCCNSMNREMHDWAIKNILPNFANISNSKDYIGALGATK
jgi:nicotinamidase-related amidase